MSKLILHQYAGSPFSEKVRALLGYKQANYNKVEIPMIMPRPYVIPLTGGYRKTPIMQIGADIYCDTALICRVIDDMFPDRRILSDATAVNDLALANWVDTFLFRCVVAITFQSDDGTNNPIFKDEAAAKAFAADRAELSKGSTQLQMELGIAKAHFLAFLNSLETQLKNVIFLGGAIPSIVDFSVFHLAWFVQGREPLRQIFTPFSAVLAWYDRMLEFGHGNVDLIEGPTALTEAKQAEPEELPESRFLDEMQPGQLVEVMPIDYGFQPVRGELVVAAFDEIAVSRSDPEVGHIVVHFPRMGFQVTPIN